MLPQLHLSVIPLLCRKMWPPSYTHVWLLSAVQPFTPVPPTNVIAARCSCATERPADSKHSYARSQLVAVIWLGTAGGCRRCKHSAGKLPGSFGTSWGMSLQAETQCAAADFL